MILSCRTLLAVIVATFSLPAPIFAADRTPTETPLATLIRAQTEEFSRAGKAGDRATLDRLLDRDVVFTNEDGSMPSRQEIIDGAAPATGNFQLVVTEFKLTSQGDVATATFVDVLTEDFHGLKLRTDFHSTEVWRKRGDQWKMIASQTTVVPHDPPPIALTTVELDDYVGEYRLAPDVHTVITRSDDTLFASTNGGQKRRLLVEYRDLLFVPGLPSGRRYIQRDGTGRVAGYVVDLNGNDVLVRKVS
jgi:ketosteroid isomerase-like protein